MTSGGTKTGMTPRIPGTFIRIEVLEEPRAERVGGGADSRRAPCDALRPGERQRLTVARDGAQGREGVRPQHGSAVADAGVARRDADARAGPKRSTSGGIGRNDRRLATAFFDHALAGACGDDDARGDFRRVDRHLAVEQPVVVHRAPLAGAAPDHVRDHGHACGAGGRGSLMCRGGRSPRPSSGPRRGPSPRSRDRESGSLQRSPRSGRRRRHRLVRAPRRFSRHCPTIAIGETEFGALGVTSRSGRWVMPPSSSLRPSQRPPWPAPDPIRGTSPSGTRRNASGSTGPEKPPGLPHPCRPTRSPPGARRRPSRSSRPSPNAPPPAPARRSCRWTLPSPQPAAGGGTEESEPVHIGQICARAARNKGRTGGIVLQAQHDVE